MSRAVTRALTLAVTWTVVLLTSTRAVQAEASLIVHNRDGAAEGLNDPTPAAPVGGNLGSTVGQQRLNALQYAADLWGAALDSDVDIAIDANFDALPCMAEGAVLGNAAPTTLIGNLGVAAANDAWTYPSALADRLAGEDANPGEADIVAVFNLLEDPACSAHSAWYYGLDGKAGDRADLVQAALHELAHGLGITMLVDANTGEMLAGMPDPVTAQALDLDTGTTLGDMPDGQRHAALGKPRRIVWSGPAVTKAAQSTLSRGALSLTTEPGIPDLSGIVSDANVGAPAGARAVRGPLMLGTPASGQTPPGSEVRGQVVLYTPTVPLDTLAAQLSASGALALLVVMPEAYALPPAPQDLVAPHPSDIPVVSIAADDGDALAMALAAGPVTISLHEATEQPIGADPQGRVYLNATQPVVGSTLGHWDMLARPNLLMEPFARPRSDPHDLGLATAWLQDLGWAADADVPSGRCGDGLQDGGEQCDNGPNNSDTEANACRLDCRAAHCGDLVRDRGEACDHGPDGSDRCSASCEIRACADEPGGCDPDGEPAARDAGTQGDGDHGDDGPAGDGDGCRDDDDCSAGNNASTEDRAPGCGCRMGGRPRGATTRGMALGLVALLWRMGRARRRRPRKSHSPT